MINRGVMGNLATLQPVLSPMLWNSAATGKYAFKHGILGFVEPDPHHGGARPFTSYSRKCKAIWNILSQLGLRSNVINFWASHPAERIKGCVVTNAFNGAKADPQRGVVVVPGTIYPDDRTAFLKQFKVFMQELSEEQLLPFVPNAAKINQDEDSRLETLAKVLSETLTTHAAATAVMETEPWDFMFIYYTGVDHFSHAFMQYHPPQLDYISNDDFEMFKDVVKGCYRFHDMMLQRLLQLAGPDTIVILCSDHGFQSREMRPNFSPREPAGPAIWHRQYGIFVAQGPGIKQDERIYGASLIDICPTILTLFDQPIGDDMDGRPLAEIFEEPPEVKYIPSWETIDGDHGLHGQEAPIDEDAAADLMQQFAALGYIDDPGSSKEEQADNAACGSRLQPCSQLRLGSAIWPSDQNYGSPGSPSAREIRFILELARLYLCAGWFAQTIRILESAFAINSSQFPGVRLMWAEAKIRLGQIDEALRILTVASKSCAKTQQPLSMLVGCTLECACGRKLKRLSNGPLPFIRKTPRLGTVWPCVYRRLGDNKRTIDAALTGLQFVYRRPKTHVDLGIALARSGKFDCAIFAFETAPKFGGNDPEPHRWLAMIYRKMQPDPEQAAIHLEQCRTLAKNRQHAITDIRDHRLKTVPLPDFPSESERNARESFITTHCQRWTAANDPAKSSSL